MEHRDPPALVQRYPERYWRCIAERMALERSANKHRCRSKPAMGLETSAVSRRTAIGPTVSTRISTALAQLRSNLTWSELGALADPTSDGCAVVPETNVNNLSGQAFLCYQSCSH